MVKILTLRIRHESSYYNLLNSVETLYYKSLMILNTPKCKVSESRNAKSNSKMVFMDEVMAVYGLESHNDL